jgi:hypothetical protein
MAYFYFCSSSSTYYFVPLFAIRFFSVFLMLLSLLKSRNIRFTNRMSYLHYVETEISVRQEIFLFMIFKLGESKKVAKKQRLSLFSSNINPHTYYNNSWLCFLLLWKLANKWSHTLMKDKYFSSMMKEPVQTMFLYFI